MEEYFDEEGSVSGQPTDYTVPVSGYICPILDESNVMNNDADEIAKSGAGRRGWSYESTIPETGERFGFELNFDPSSPNPLLIASELEAQCGFYHVTWTLFPETTGIGVDFWCAAYPGDQDSGNIEAAGIKMRMVSTVPCTDLVGVIQQSYVDKNETREQGG